MNIKNIFHFSLDFFVRRFGMNILLMVICGITAYMTDFLLTLYFQQEYEYQLVTGTYGVDVDSLNHIDFSQSASGDINKYESIKTQIEAISGVSCVGTFSASNTYIKETDELINYIAVDASALSLGAASVTDQQMQAVNQKLLEGYLPVLVGNHLKNQYKVGEIYNDKFDEAVPKLYIVGYLPEGAKWMKRGNPFKFNYVETVSLSDEILIIKSQMKDYERLVVDGYPGDMYYTVEAGADDAAIQMEINQIVKKEGYYISINNIGKIIDDQRQNNKIYNINEFYAKALIMIIAMLSVSAATIVTIILSKKHFGILYACGVSMKEISVMTAINNTIVVLLPTVLVYFYRAYEEWKTVTTEMDRAALTYAHMQCVPIAQGIISLLIIMVSIAVPIYMIHNMNPVDLINRAD